METTATRSPALSRLWSLVLLGLLLVSLGLGVLALLARVDPNLHGMAAFVTAALAIASHMRRATGWDLVAVVLLVLTVWLGLIAPGGGVAAGLHPAAALTAATPSAGLHLQGWRR